MSTAAATESPLLIDRSEPHIAVITLNRPQAGNAISPELARALDTAVRETEADPDVWVTVLTGAGGKVFCAGADLKAIAAGRAEQLMTRDGGFAGFVDARRTKPWIAAVEGLALAGGCELALACDLIVAGQNTKFSLPEVKRGLIALAGGLYRLPRALPRALALELILTGESLDAVTAHAHGMVNRVVAPGAVRDEALQLARAIAANAPLAVRESLKIAAQALELDEAELKRMGVSAWARLCASEDFREGPRAFIEKRAPNWQGR